MKFIAVFSCAHEIYLLADIYFHDSWNKKEKTFSFSYRSRLQ